MADQRGSELRARAQGGRSGDMQRHLAALDEGVGRWADEFVFGEVWDRAGLEFPERMLVAITSLATQGRADLLRNYLHGALQAGVSARKIHESLVMLVVYAGFPTATVMLNEWRTVLDSARRQGAPIVDDVGPLPARSPLTDRLDSPPHEEVDH
jgi:4-carboxymuconolactone decarboxylase